MRDRQERLSRRTLRQKLGHRFSKLPVGAIGIYTYYQRLAQGLRQLMAGARKFGLKYIDGTDIASLTMEASCITGIPHVSDIEAEEVNEILDGVEQAPVAAD